ncbi:hypothetical protein [Micromonospora chersina]|uniref:hypothetical protein n=1 Tax=Micromonospora chersina TaxID=47854 RepID=UPI00369E92E8
MQEIVGESLARPLVVPAAGAAVDGIHALSALALAAADPRQRPAALTDSAAARAALGATAERHKEEL